MGNEMGETQVLRCDMDRTCQKPVACVDHRGFIYCDGHGLERKASGERCRKLRPAEIKTLKAGGTIRYCCR